MDNAYKPIVQAMEEPPDPSWKSTWKAAGNICGWINIVCLIFYVVCIFAGWDVGETICNWIHIIFGVLFVVCKLVEWLYYGEESKIVDVVEKVVDHDKNE